MLVAKNPWPDLKFDTTSTCLFEAIDPSKCIFLRGRENWLARLDIPGPPSSLSEEILTSIRQEVRALCGQWLKMQNLCALLGAGTSKYVTGFVGDGLFDRVCRILAGRPRRETLDALARVTSSPEALGMDFEAFLSQLTAFGRVLKGQQGPLSAVTQEWKIEGLGAGHQAAEVLTELLLDIERAIAVACNVTLPESELTLRGTSITPHEAFLAKLVSRDPQQGRGRLFTPNYDTLIEQAMDRLGILYSDGFTGTLARSFNPSSYDLDSYYPGEVTAGRVRRYDKVLQLYKLHGSITWRRTPPRAGDPFGILWDPRPLPTEADVTAQPAVLDTLFGSEQGLAILPTSAKYGESMTMPYAHLFRAMAHALREPQTACFVIGYRGWDLHINRIIEDSLTNPGFTCVLISPSLSDWARCLLSADYSGRVYAITGPWATFEFFAEELLPDLEILKTDLLIARTLRDLQRNRPPEEGAVARDQP